ncbi:MAG: hypothetical protein U9Q85_02190 [Patescibacteria group bacterium]|nr:hypothetical protein [Patescibacteria group bacterium]
MFKFIILFSLIAFILILGAQSFSLSSSTSADQEETNRFLDPDIATGLIEREEQGAEELLDKLISGNLDRFKNKEDLDGIDFDALRDRVKEQIQEIIKENKDELLNSWEEKLDAVIANIINEIEKEESGEKSNFSKKQD